MMKLRNNCADRRCIFTLGGIAFLSVCFHLVLFLAPAGAADLILVPGQQKTINAPDMNRIAVGNPAIADVKALEGTKQVLVTAVGLGQTDIIIWDMKNRQRSIKVQVVQNDPKKVAREIQSLLRGVEGIRVEPLDTKVIIDGKVLRKEDLNKINKIATLYPQVTNFATLSPAVIDAIINHINIEFRDAGLKKVKAERMGNQVIVQGEVPNENEKKKIEMIASAFEVKVQNFVKVGVTLEKMILVNVDFIEMDKDSITGTGISWADAINATGIISGSALFGPDVDSTAFNGSYRLNSGYSATINLLQNNRNAHIIARPKLLCRNGEKAEFLAGGEVPVIVSTLATAKVDYKQFGIILNIEPVADDEGNIATAIMVENSTISDFVDGQPAFQSSRVKTNINVKSGQIIVLSGLVNRERSKAVDKIPGLGSIPILGELFKSRSFMTNKSELVIFVTPELLSPEDDKNKEIIETSRKQSDAMEDELTFKLLD